MKIDVQPMLLKWVNVQEFMDSILPKTMAMVPLKLWAKDEQEKF